MNEQPDQQHEEEIPAAEVCPHGKTPGNCNPCDYAKELEY